MVYAYRAYFAPWLKELRICYMYGALVSHHGLKNKKYVTCVEHLFRTMALRTTNLTCVAPLFWIMALRTTYISCVARLFGSLAENFYVFRELTSGESDRPFPGQTDSIESDGVCLPAS